MDSEITDERKLREELAHFCRVAYRRHLVSGAGGNLSARIGDSQRVLISPSGFSLRDCEPEHFVTVDLEGKKVGGPDGLVPSKESVMHTAIYQVRPQARAVAHLHPRACIVFANRLEPIPLATVSARAKLGFTPIVAEAPSGSQALARFVRQAVQDAPASNFFLLERHGALAIGANPRDATDLADLAEDTARIALDSARAQGLLVRRRIFDVSVRTSAKMPFYPGDPQFVLTRVKALERGDAANVSQIAMGVHTGTHIDAPAHFLTGGATLDGLPLEATIGEAVVADLRGRARIEAASLKEVSLGAGDILLCKTDNSALWDREDFQKDYVALTAEAAHYLIERGIKAVGIDYLSIEAFGSNDFRVHKLILGAGITVIEGLDLSGVMPGRYEFFCLPLALSGVEGAPARAILIER